MTSSFFVFGLPRSRTAWLSVFLSQSGTYCHHEAISGCYTEVDYIDKVDGCGDSTTAFELCPESEISNAPIVIIEKSKSELDRCVEFCDKTFNTDSTKIVLSQNDKLMAMPGMRVLQSQINDKLPVIFEYLTGVEWLDKYAIMSKFNIQADANDIDYKSMEAYLDAKL